MEDFKEGIAYHEAGHAALAIVFNWPLDYVTVVESKERVGLLEQKIKQIDYFVSILAPGVLKSENLRKEISWASESNRLCILFWHAGFSYNDDVNSREDLSKEVKENISRKNAYITTGDESAMKYHDAIERLINRLK